VVLGKKYILKLHPLFSFAEIKKKWEILIKFVTKKDPNLLMYRFYVV